MTLKGVLFNERITVSIRFKKVTINPSTGHQFSDFNYLNEDYANKLTIHYGLSKIENQDYWNMLRKTTINFFKT